MNKLILKISFVVVAAIISIGAPALAMESSSTDQTSSGSDSSRSQHEATMAADETTIEDHLSSAKLKVCQVHERVINSIMGRIAKRGQHRLDVYTTIATRVEDFYAKKGKTVSNYDALVADVNAKKDAAQATVDKVGADQVQFKCDGTDPKGVASSFKQDLKEEITALHDYQQSIKNLIVAVKSAQSQTSTDSNNDTTGGQQ